MMLLMIAWTVFYSFKSVTCLSQLYIYSWLQYRFLWPLTLRNTAHYWWSEISPKNNCIKTVICWTVKCTNNLQPPSEICFQVVHNKLQTAAKLSGHLQWRLLLLHTGMCLSFKMYLKMKRSWSQKVMYISGITIHNIYFCQTQQIAQGACVFDTQTHEGEHALKKLI